MTTPDLLVALATVLEVLRRLQVRHFVGGSIASSVHGVPRASIDADVVAELRPGHAAPFVSALRGAYYVPEQRILDAIGRRASFNVIHLDTMVKIDVFVTGDRPFEHRAFDRAGSVTLEGGTTLPVSSAEDTIVAKLAWFRRGGGVSERQWTDVLGLLRVSPVLDRRYLIDCARELNVDDLLRRALDEAGRGPIDG